MHIEKRAYFYVGAIVIVVGGYYYYLRNKQNATNATAASIVADTQSGTVTNDLSIPDKATVNNSLQRQTDNLLSTFSDTYYDYNVDPSAIPSHGTYGDGNSLNQGVPSEVVVAQQLQAQVVANPLQAPTASAVQSAMPTVDLEAIYYPKIPSYSN